MDSNLIVQLKDPFTECTNSFCFHAKVNIYIPLFVIEAKKTAHLVSVVHPGTEFEMAGLIIEGEVHHIHWTG